MSSPSPAYRKLARATVASTFLLIVLGGFVRVSNSGLGCGPGGSGFHGWPLCRGDILPGLGLHTYIEYAHRAVASILVVLMLALAVIAWRRYREHRAIVRAAAAGVALVVVQALLGAATVEKDLDEPLVAAHLGTAMLLLALALFIWRAARPGAAAQPPLAGGRGFRPLALTSTALLFLAIVAGGYMAGTQHYGRVDYHLGQGAHHACGRSFPTCNGAFMPFGSSRLVDIHLTHRLLVYLASAALIALVAVALRRHATGAVRRFAWTLLGLLCLQLLLGALNVWLEEYGALIVAHLAAATLLWGTLVALVIRLYPVPAPLPSALRPASDRAEAVPA